MNNKPIIFNADMVRALLDGRKTVTRRPLKPQPDLYAEFPKHIKDKQWCFHDDTVDYRQCPYQIGDTLWVKETWNDNNGELPYIEYRADFPLKWNAEETCHDEPVEILASERKWTPSIHMPKWASRITLKITDIRIEKIQDITEEGAKAEGAKPSFIDEFDIVHTQPSYRDGFILNIWNSIYNTKNKPEFAWDKNPWVWVISFEVIIKSAKND